jgi:hypothetical protein
MKQKTLIENNDYSSKKEIYPGSRYKYKNPTGGWASLLHCPVSCKDF